MLCRATQDGQVTVESSHKMWTTGGGNSKPVFLLRESHEQYDKAKRFDAGRRASSHPPVGRCPICYWGRVEGNSVGTPCEMPGWMNQKLESRLTREISITWYADDTTLMAESEVLKSLLMKVKEESEKAGLKLNMQKMKIMTSAPITSWQIDGDTMETDRPYFLGLHNHCREWLQPWN